MTSPTMIERPDGSWITPSPPLRESLPDATRREFDLHTLDIWRKVGRVRSAQQTMSRALQSRDVVDTEILDPLFRDLADQRGELLQSVQEFVSFCLQEQR